MRRSPLRSALRPTMIIATMPNAYGIADSRPMSTADLTPVDLMIDGSQKLKPYCPIELPKYTSARIQTLPLLNTSRSEWPVLPWPSASILWASSAFSAGFSQPALAMPSSR